MKEYFVDLTNGERLPVKVNFGTIYYLQKTKGFHALVKKTDDPKSMTEEESMDLAADLVYAILRSNGKAVTFDEALQLIPPDTASIEYMLKGFQSEYDRYSKKKRAKGPMRPPGRSTGRGT